MQPIIQVSGLTKVYPAAAGNSIEAVRGIDFTVDRQEVFGLLGPNGAGKSTTIGMLTTMVKITGGSASIAGVDADADPIGLKEKIAVVPQATNLDRGLTARENLLFHAAYFGVEQGKRESRADELLELMALEGRADDYPAGFSGGMARRLMIARALMHDPEVIFLDEATTGLDPQSRLMIRRKVGELRAGGKTIFLTTHYMEEADQLCDRVAIMDKGRILALDTPKKLKEMIPGGSVIELTVNEGASGLAERLKSPLVGAEKVELEGLTVRLFLSRPEEALMDIVEIVRGAGLRLEGVQLHPVTLEDVFVEMTGRGLRE